MLARPYEEAAARVLNSFELEVWFVTGPWARQHALLAVLDHPSLRPKGPTAKQVRQLRKDFLALEPAALVERWYERSLSGLGRALATLGLERASDEGSYEDLISILADGGLGAKTIQHARRLTFDEINLLASVPHWFRYDKVRQMCPRLAHQVALVAEALVLCGLVPSPADFRAVVGHRYFYIDPMSAFRRLGVVFRFPEPPWPGDEHLRHIQTSEELKSVSKRFGNCAFNHLEACFAGSRVFYEWCGAEPALVELRVIAGLSWGVSQVLGVGNVDVSSRTLIAIAAALPDDVINRRYYRQIEMFGLRASEIVPELRSFLE